MKKKHSPIVDKNTREQFNHIIKENGFDPIDYYAFSAHNNCDESNRYIMSNTEWQDMYDKKDFCSGDVVRKIVTGTKAKLVVFDHLLISSDESLQIMNLRKQYDINNGFMILKKENNFTYQLTMASSLQSFDLAEFLEENFNNVENLIAKLSGVINYK
jgi:hypothetical protein